MESHDCPMKDCKNEAKCKCFEIDFDEKGVVYFCSPKCLKDCADEGGFDVEDYEEHLFECEQYGEFEKEWVKKLQKKFLENNLYHLEREGYWHKRVEELKNYHKEQIDMIQKKIGRDVSEL